jgi:hypothetical protein
MKSCVSFISVSRRKISPLLGTNASDGMAVYFLGYIGGGLRDMLSHWVTSTRREIHDEPWRKYEPAYRLRESPN